LSSWRLTTSGSALANQAKRLSSRLLMLLMLKVATLTSLLCPCTYECASQKEQPKCVALAGIILPVERDGKPRTKTEGLVPKVAGLQLFAALAAPQYYGLPDWGTLGAHKSGATNCYQLRRG